MRWIIAVVFAAGLAWASAADAGSVRITVGSPPRRAPQRFVVEDRGGLQVFGERRLTVVPAPSCQDVFRNKVACGATPPAGHHRHLHQRTIIVPQPIYVVPSRHCHVPGYWHTHWLPQQALYNLWVPGQWGADGSWVEGHYEQHPYISGYVPQYIWVPERWSC